MDPASPRNALQNSLIGTDLDLQVDAGFWDVYLPREDLTLDGSIDGVRAAPWLPTVRALAEENSSVRVTVRAVAYTGLGWIREDSALVQHGLRLYAQALRETNQMLQDPEQTLSDAVLASCRTLSLFEMFRRGPGIPETGQNQATDWRSHTEGTFRLLQLRGPNRHQSEHGYNLYDGVRMTAIIHGIARRQPNGFTSLTWDLLEHKNLRDMLFDSMTIVPELLRQIDNFTSQNINGFGYEARCSFMKQGKILMEEVMPICTMLHEWESRALELCISQALSTPDGSQPTTPTEQNPPLVDVCLAHGFGFFFVCTQYWSMCVKLYSTVSLLQRQILALAKELEAGMDLPTIPDWINAEPPAHHIANTASNFFSPEAGLWSAQSAIFPIGTALLYFARTGRANSDVVKKMTDAFSDNKAGAIMRDFLQSTGMYVKR